MKPLIFEFLEEPVNQVHENPFEYSPTLNLSVDKETGQPAIEYSNLDTRLVTKVSRENSGSDHNLTKAYLDTRIDTLSNGENSGSENDVRSRFLLDTGTGTRVHNETDDPDSPIRNYRDILSTQTFTESKEATDADR